MIRTYVFGCHEQIDGLRTFTVNVSIPDSKVGSTDAQQRAMDAAMEVARKESLANPTLIFEMGMPDLKVINDHVNDETTTVFCRNSELPPIVSVIDIDHTPSPEEAVLERQRVIDLLKSGGYQRIPHLIE